ncbi:MAG: hypothetical protein CVV05_00960 [Gammaproteobacteria bacterium HGW-Gammaproteobacteria-1]|jgi:hypothetical protein|nr:MAG: hypothetical protein CVV05_00960 [Gammaproteobacteria bacterium HGW-Gammaproteobacteria-1]
MSQQPVDLGRDLENLLFFALLFVATAVGLYLYPFPASWAWHWLTTFEVFLLEQVDFILPENVRYSLPTIKEGLDRHAAGAVPWRTMLKVETVLFPFNSIIYTVIIGSVGSWIWFGATWHHQRHSTETLLNIMTRTFRFSRMWVKYNPLKTGGGDITKGPFRLSISPAEFASEHNLIIRILGQENQFHRGGATKALTAQLGPRFTGIKDLDEQERWLAAAFLLRAHRKKKESDELLGDISYFYADEFAKADVNESANKALKQFGDGEVARRLAKAHAYKYTWFTGLMNEAKACGKLNTSKVPWVILKDRTLFFALNNLLRPAVHTEALAAAIHYQAEIEKGKALTKPAIKAAVDQLELALISERLLPTPAP